MALILKELFTENEVDFLKEKSLIFDKNDNFYGIRDKDLDVVLDYVKSNISESTAKPEDLESRAYVMKVNTIIIGMIKKSETLDHQIGLLSCINSLFLIDSDSASRLLTLFKSSINW